MRLVTTYAEPSGWYFEFCTLDEAKAAECIYPDVGCVHQGYNIPTPTIEPFDGWSLKDLAMAVAVVKAIPFLEAELARTIPIWEGARIAAQRLQDVKERRMRAEASDKALAEKMLAEERAKLTPPVRVP